MYEGALVADRYRLEARIGSGSTGQVWRATDERLQRVVAVKVVDLSQSNEAVTPERVRREVIATARLNHPNIVTIFDAGTDADLAFLVMELLPGRSLAQLVRAEGVLDVERVVDIALQVSRALESTHAIGVVHRDIKPANIMVTGATAKILDFGIAQLATENAATLTSPATALGTAAYMSPEQALGRKAGPKTDVYSLGCVLMALLTGAPPFTGQSSVEVANRQIDAEPPRVSDRRPDIRPAVDELVASMLAKQPEQRPSAREVSDALAALRAGAGAADPATAPLGRTAVLPAGTALLPAGGTPAAPSSPGSVASAVRMGASDGTPRTSGGASRPRGDAWFGQGLRAISAVIAVVVLVAAIWVAGSALLREAADRVAPRASAPTTKPTTRTGPVLPTINLPTISAPTLPSANRAARRAAVAVVSAALRGLSPATASGQRAKEDLVTAWDSAGANIVADENPSRELSRFSNSVERAHARGALSDAEHAAVAIALRSVGALL